MAIDNASFVAGLDPNLPRNDDPRAEGAAQIRAVKQAIQNTFPKFDGEVSITAQRLNEMAQQQMAVGMIMMFSGDTPPAGWSFCDGSVSNGFLTPDLRGKFIQGWNPARTGVDPLDVIDINSTGGENIESDMSQFVQSEPHKLTIQELPKHTPEFADSTMKFYEYTCDDGKGRRIYGPEAWGDELKFKEIGGDNAHKHDLKSSGVDFDKRPEWYALAYICYVGHPPV